MGRLVAERLGFRYVDEEIVAQAAEQEGLDVADVADAERRKGWLARFFEELGEGGDPEAYAVGGYVPSATGTPIRTSEHYAALIADAVQQTAGSGQAVIVAHAASHALRGQAGIVRVLVTAPPELRAQRIAAERELDDKAAAKVVKDSDTARADYLRRFYEVDRELPTHYDLVLNTERLTPEDAAGLIVAAVGSSV